VEWLRVKALSSKSQYHKINKLISSSKKFDINFTCKCFGSPITTKNSGAVLLNYISVF
jgi:hypothetical protein